MQGRRTPVGWSTSTGLGQNPSLYPPVMRSTEIRNDHTLSLLVINYKHRSCTAVSVSSDNLKCNNTDCTFRQDQRLAVRAPQSVLYGNRYPAQHPGDSGVDPRVVGLSTLSAVADDAQLGQSEDSIQYFSVVRII